MLIHILYIEMDGSPTLRLLNINRITSHENGEFVP